MTKALMLSLTDWYADQPEKNRVCRVRLVVGRFTCVEPDLLRSAFTRQKIGTFLADAEIVIRESKFVAHCRACDKDYQPELTLEYACPLCNSPLEEIVSGRELKIEGVEWDESETQP